jgi:hypothetical protein
MVVHSPAKKKKKGCAIQAVLGWKYSMGVLLVSWDGRRELA